MTDKEKLMEILNVALLPQPDTELLEAMAEFLMDNDVRPVRHARWNVSYEEAGAFETTRTYYFGHCSDCGRKVDIWCSSGLYRNEDLKFAKQKVIENYPFCHCGAKMDNG